VSAVTLMRRLSSNSRKNQVYKAFREVGRVMRTVALLRFLADSGLRARVTAAPTRPRPTTGSPPGPRFGNQGVIAENDPAEQEKSVKWNSLLCKSDRVPHRDRHDGGHPAAGCRGWQVTAEDLAQLSPYLTSHILRFGAYATDELHIPPDVFDPALDEVDFGGEQPAAA
jgi:Tn3 transposase DDE domain